MNQVGRDALQGGISQRGIKVVSFDAEGTLVTHDFSCTVWQEAIPALYARKKGIEYDQAERIVFTEYDRVGDQRLEWYDVAYWLRYFELGTLEALLQDCRDKVRCYTEVREVLSSLAGRYKLIVCSGTPLELLQPLLEGISSYFARVFSAPSHYRQLKTSDFYLWVCQEMKVRPDEVVHVGDSWQSDFVNSRQAGLRAFYLDRSGNDHQSLTDLRQLERNLLE